MRNQNRFEYSIVENEFCYVRHVGTRKGTIRFLLPEYSYEESMPFARDVEQNIDGFLDDLDKYLETEAVRFSMKTNITREIRTILVNEIRNFSVSVFEFNGPDSFIVSFLPTECHNLWRCGYINGRFMGLIFDI